MENQIKPVELDIFQGHIVLYCKGHYIYKKDDFFEGLKMIWSIRCGLIYSRGMGNGLYEHIADSMYDIISKCEAKRMNYLQSNIHRELVRNSFWKPKNMTHIMALIWEYRSIISNMQIKKSVGKKYVPLVLLPKPKKRIFNRILNEKGKFNDYELICKYK